MSGDDVLLERALGELGGGKHYPDRLGPAIYQVEPSWATAILCRRCQYVAIIPRLPRKHLFSHQCSSCGASITLAPPAEVLDAAPTQSALRSGPTGPGRLA